ncbi:cereblon family protein [Desulfonatronum thioautotrophicum]|uniref:cereblon family protein n=1 Tax=Desulfonatronum thioautotrophicum TaxID=617001 RepID=UPI0005EB96CE|nr:cereblon family protein [Desulfonatronum thioautotrophicum]
MTSHAARLPCVTLLRQDQATPGRNPSTLSFDAPGEARQSALRCKACGREVTTEDQRIAVNGRHDHVFFNPHGHVFEIGCFAQAPGAVPASPPCAEFSWFPGLAWQVAACANCGAHLGWYFQDGEVEGFFGLILDRLVLDNNTAP